jgi:hypothetical protein
VGESRGAGYNNFHVYLLNGNEVDEIFSLENDPSGGAFQANYQYLPITSIFNKQVTGVEAAGTNESFIFPVFRRHAGSTQEEKILLARHDNGTVEELISTGQFVDGAFCIYFDLIEAYGNVGLIKMTTTAGIRLYRLIERE